MSYKLSISGAVPATAMKINVKKGAVNVEIRLQDACTGDSEIKIILEKETPADHEDCVPVRETQAPVKPPDSMQ